MQVSHPKGGDSGADFSTDENGGLVAALNKLTQPAQKSVNESFFMKYPSKGKCITVS